VTTLKYYSRGIGVGLKVSTGWNYTITDILCLPADGDYTIC